jgi:SpoVK/Ycf46/Vps4 family AAA+-type ATPase
MAKSDLLVSLVRAGASGDRTQLRSTVEALVADERAKSHHSLAERLERALQAVAVTPPPLTSARPNNTGRDTILEVTPRTRLEDLILPLPVRRNGEQLVEEHIRSDVLRANGLEPRHRVLLSGPPGNGKTSFAEGIAEALALPLFLVRYDTLIGSYLGETNTRLRALCDYVRTRPSVLFFDEFDALGKERGDTHETGEIKRVVSFLLMQFDQMPSYVVLIAATNHAELLDRAVWRRFQLRLDFPAPDRSMVAAFLERAMASWPAKPDIAAVELARKLGPVSYAEALDFCQNTRRRQVLGLGEVTVGEAVEVELNLWASRVNPIEQHAQRPNKTAPSPRSIAKRAAGKGPAGPKPEA